MADVVNLPDLRVTRVQGLRILSIRLRRARAATARRLGVALGVEVPASNRATGVDPRLCWLSPVGWMVVSSCDIDGIEAALADVTSVVYDASEDRAVFRIDGSRAVDMLAKGMSLDLHPRAFAVGRCSSTRFAQTLVTIDRPSVDHFLVYADVSFAVHLDRWFRDAAIEFQIQDVSP